MKKNNIWRITSVVIAVAISCTSIIGNRAMAASTISVDGDASEWEGVTFYDSSDSNVEKWSVVQDAEYYYFYVQQNGGDQYSMPITKTKMAVTYTDGTSNNSNMIQFSWDASCMKDGYYGDIEGSSIQYQPSQEYNKYEVEYAIPKTFFSQDDFTITYCGSTVKSSEIVDMKEVEVPDDTEPVYNGITIDGGFADWNAITKTTVDNEAMDSVAAVFDGDYVYIYIKEKSPGAISWSGECNNGNFTITTDLGRNTPFKISRDGVTGVDGASLKYSNLQYEIAIPASAVKQYKDTISFGYYMADGILIDGIVNLQDQEEEEKTFSGILYDGLYGDWDYYPHQLVQYSTSGGKGDDAEAALYVDDTTLYGHVVSNLKLNKNEFAPFSIRVNENTQINFHFVAVDANGNINKNPNLHKLDNGTYEFYLWDYNSESSAKNINDPDCPIYGKIYVTIGNTKDEMEYKIDIEKMAAHFGLDANDLKMIQAQYINLGREWVSIAGTSSGAVMGISLCMLSCVGVFAFRRKRKKGMLL